MRFIALIFDFALQLYNTVIFQGWIMQLTSLPNSLRPREKLLEKGAKALSDAELLAIFLRTGLPGMNAIELAQHLINENKTLHNFV